MKPTVYPTIIYSHMNGHINNPNKRKKTKIKKRSQKKSVENMNRVTERNDDDWKSKGTKLWVNECGPQSLRYNVPGIREKTEISTIDWKVMFRRMISVILKLQSKLAQSVHLESVFFPPGRTRLSIELMNDYSNNSFLFVCIE